jgi:hypothetical protein
MKPKHFELYELLPEKFYNSNIHRGDNLWFIFDSRLLITLDNLREIFGKMVINNWYWRGHRQYSGYRPPDCTVGAELSQHRFGRAADIIILEHSIDSVRNWIIKNKNKNNGFITGIELGTSWLHIDVRNYDGLLLFD